jgi:hypothetical protein
MKLLPNLLNLKPNQQWNSFSFSKLVRGQSILALTSPATMQDVWCVTQSTSIHFIPFPYSPSQGLMA